MGLGFYDQFVWVGTLHKGGASGAGTVNTSIDSFRQNEKIRQYFSKRKIGLAPAASRPDRRGLVGQLARDLAHARGALGHVLQKLAALGLCGSE